MANTTGKKFGGRAKGTPNKITFELRQKIQAFLELNIATMQQDFDQIQDPEKRLLFMEKLFGYIAPKGSLITLQTNEPKKDPPFWLSSGKPQMVEIEAAEKGKEITSGF